MAGEDEVLLVDGVVSLSDPGGPVDLHVVSVRVEADDGEVVAARLHGGVEPAGWAGIDERCLFRLDHGLRGPGTVAPGRPVLLELLLGAEYLDAVDDGGSLWAALEAGRAPLAAAGSWLALEACTPEEDDSCSGFVTAWAAEDQPPTGIQPAALSALEGAALAAFLEGGWQPTRWPGSPRQLVADDLGDDVDLVVVVQVFDDEARLAVVVRLPGEATDPLALAGAAAVVTTHLQAGSDVAFAIEVDLDAGTATVVTGLDAAAGPPAPAAVLDALEATVDAARTAYEALAEHLDPG